MEKHIIFSFNLHESLLKNYYRLYLVKWRAVENVLIVLLIAFLLVPGLQIIIAISFLILLIVFLLKILLSFVLFHEILKLLDQLLDNNLYGDLLDLFLLENPQKWDRKQEVNIILIFLFEFGGASKQCIDYICC